VNVNLFDNDSDSDSVIDDVEWMDDDISNQVVDTNEVMIINP
jgi:hypothetical protein